MNPLMGETCFRYETHISRSYTYCRVDGISWIPNIAYHGYQMHFKILSFMHFKFLLYNHYWPWQWPCLCAYACLRAHLRAHAWVPIPVCPCLGSGLRAHSCVPMSSCRCLRDHQRRIVRGSDRATCDHLTVTALPYQWHKRYQCPRSWPRKWLWLWKWYMKYLFMVYTIHNIYVSMVSIINNIYV